MTPNPLVLPSFAALVTASVFMSGCADAPETTTMKEKSAPKPTMTDDIGEYDPGKGKEVVDSTVKVSNPLTYALDARESALEQVAEIPIIQGVQLFHATEGRYPKDHEEFMTRVIKANKIKLPKLSEGMRYEYDVENHKLMIVREEPQK